MLFLLTAFFKATIRGLSITVSVVIVALEGNVDTHKTMANRTV